MVEDNHLTPEQLSMVEEIKLIATMTGVDYKSSLEDPSRADWITSDLQDSLEMIVRGYIVTEYTLLDEIMNRFMLGFLLGEESRDELGRITDPRAEDITHYILESMFLLQKAALFRKLHKPPAHFNQFLEATNSLRNAVAHTFVIEQRRRPTEYKGEYIFSFQGLRQFAEDRNQVMAYIEEEHPALLA